MKIKKIILILFILNLFGTHVYPIEPEIFVQSTVNRASQILSENISKEEKINHINQKNEKNFSYSDTFES